MATKKGKKKGTKKVKAAAKKGSSASRPKKKAATRPPTKATARKPTARKPAARKPAARKPVARKPPPRKAAAKTAATKPAKKVTRARASGSTASAMEPVRREDRPGHLNPRYVAKLREQSGQREANPRAFLEAPRSPGDDLAEELGEDVVSRATSGEDETEEALDQVVPEEQGGPFVETNAAQEFAHGTDASNPKGAKREPFPRS